MANKTVTVKSTTNPKVEGEYRLPGTVWECPKKLAGELQEIGAIEIVPKSKKPADKPADKNENNDAHDSEGDQSAGGSGDA